MGRLTHDIQTVIRKGAIWKPDLFVIEMDGVHTLIKDYSATPFFYRVCIGQWSNRREAKMYQKLRGIPGIPMFRGAFGKNAIAVEYVSGVSGDRIAPSELTPRFLDDLRRLIDTIHERGVVHCDLRNIKNILRGDDGLPYIVDFATAFTRSKPWNFIKNGLYRIFYQDDLLAVLKLKRVRAPHLLTREEEHILDRGVFLQKEAIFIKTHMQTFLKKIFYRTAKGSQRQRRGGNAFH